MITLRKEESGVLVMELSEHLWPEDLELAIPVVHDVARSYQNPLLLLVDVVSSFDTSPFTFLCQILQPGVLAQNRPSRVAVLTSIAEERESIPSKQIPEVEIRFFSSCHSRRPIACLRFSANTITSAENSQRRAAVSRNGIKAGDCEAAKELSAGLKEN
jgi:hypothetical protein